jgi:hypothetical protein
MAASGTTSPTIMRAAALIAGAKTVFWASPTASAGCAFRRRSGTAGTRFWLKRLPAFYKRLVWFRKFRRDLPHHITHYEHIRGRRMIALPSRKRLQRILRYMLDENEFLSPTASARYPGSTPSIPTNSKSTATPIGSITSRENRPPACSAAIRTGGVRSGCRSTTCSSRRWNATTIFMATISRWNAPPARAMSLRWTRCRMNWRGAWHLFFSGTPMGGAPATAMDPAGTAIRIGAIWCGSTSIFTVKPARASVPAIRPAGWPWQSGSSMTCIGSPPLLSVHPELACFRMDAHYN